MADNKSKYQCSWYELRIRHETRQREGRGNGEIDRFTAYERLQRRRWVPGEPADVFLADLRRLAKLAHIQDEEAIRGAFVVGLPADISQQLRASVRSFSCKLSTLCEQARILLQQKMQQEEDLAAMAVPRGRQPQRARQGPKAEPVDRRCFLCHGDHLARRCPDRADQRGVRCWRCGEPGHLLRTCPSQDQGNGSREGPSVA